MRTNLAVNLFAVSSFFKHASNQGPLSKQSGRGPVGAYHCMEIVSLYNWQVLGSFCRAYLERWWEESEECAHQIVGSCLHPGDNLPLILVARMNGSLRGVVMLSMDNRDVSDIAGPWLMMLYVLPQYRNRGIGAALVAKACKHLQKLGYQSAHIDTTTARGFFEKLGWTFVEMASWRGEGTAIMSVSLDKHQEHAPAAKGREAA